MNPLILALLQAGVIDLDMAEMLERQLNPEAARQWAELVMMESTQRALDGQQARLLDLVRTQPTQAQVDAFFAAENERLWAAVRNDWLTVVQERAITAAVTGGFEGSFDAINQQAIDWAENYYTSFDPGNVGRIEGLNETGRAQFAEQFARWNRGELTPAGARGKGLPDLIEALQPTFGPVRSELIGVTETTRIFVEAQRQVEDANPNVVAYRYQTAADEDVCERCGPLHGQVRRKGERSYNHPTLGQIEGPPIHGRCRCAEVPETQLTIGIELAPEETFVWRGELPEPANA